MVSGPHVFRSSNDHPTVSWPKHYDCRVTIYYWWPDGMMWAWNWTGDSLWRHKHKQIWCHNINILFLTKDRFEMKLINWDNKLIFTWCELPLITKQALMKPWLCHSETQTRTPIPPSPPNLYPNHSQMTFWIWNKNNN